MCISIYKKLHFSVAYMHCFVFRASAVSHRACRTCSNVKNGFRLFIKMSMRAVGYKKRNTKDIRDTGYVEKQPDWRWWDCLKLVFMKRWLSETHAPRYSIHEENWKWRLSSSRLNSALSGGRKARMKWVLSWSTVSRLLINNVRAHFGLYF